MEKTTPNYFQEFFSSQLQKIRIYRDFNSQAQLSDNLNIPRQTFHLWEKGERYPNISQLLNLCNFLEVDIRYFFSQEAKPEEYDLRLISPATHLTRDFSPEMINAMKLMPFTETYASRQLYGIFKQCLSGHGCYGITVPAGSGTTRTLHEYMLTNSRSVKIVEAHNFFAEILEKKRDSRLLLFDDADRLPVKLFKLIMEKFSQDYTGSIVLLGSNIRDVSRELNYLNRMKRCFSTDTITSWDFDRITQAALPAADRKILNLLRLGTGVRLDQLYKVINKIRQETPPGSHTFPAAERLLEFCDNL